LRKIQEAAQAGYTRVLPTGRPDRIGQFIDRLRNDGNVLYGPELLAQTGKPQKVPGLVRHVWDTGTDKVTGAMNLGAGTAQKPIVDLLHGGDKAREAEFFSRYAPGAMGETLSLDKVLQEMGHSPRKGRIGRKRLEKLLPELQQHLRTRFPQGFVMKETRGVQSAGRFPTHKDDLLDLLNTYDQQNLGQVFQDKLNAVARSQAKNTNPVYREMQQTPGWSGRVLDQLRTSPDNVLVQEMLPIERKEGLRGTLADLLGNPRNQEIRVHVEGGRAVPELAVSRYDPLMHVFDRQKLTDAAAYAQSIIDKLPEEYRAANYAMDIAPVQTGGFKLVESNPTANSGLLSNVPLAPELLARQMTGRWGKHVAGAGAGAAAVGAGTAGALAGKGLDHYLTRPRNDTPTPTPSAPAPSPPAATPAPYAPGTKL
jgi:hypothetical protein